MSEPPKARAYRSDMRTRHAAETRRLVVASAAELFITQGYAATSINAIAEAAGVSRSTVFTAAGGKLTLLKTAYDEAIVGDDRPVPLAERPASREMRSLTEGSQIVARYTGILAAAMSRVSALYEVVRVAADTEPDAALLWQDIQRQRLDGARQIVELLVAVGPLTGSLTPDRAADVITVYNDPGVHHQLVRNRGWQEDAFRRWLARTLHHELLDGPPEEA
ncbi:helix-turn-helix domain-containing protein [Streptomyces sp. SID3212]|uniref:TetR/AcrR family transcriptional regulator n=1 Tax=unclassified Streptomyces TaxID=2593676 RepID=UPI00136D2320|nr:helix-turn-helix domain-containing protein [Streptomyces sp. SID3212]MYV56161.1 TetR family transcriptional regulator [Streptomyces sp. SID3212]